MVSESSLILDSVQVKQKIRRMASEIYEHNFNEKTIVIAGIAGKGYVLAGLLIKEVESISPIKTILVKLTLDKSAPQQSDVTLDCNIKDLQKKCIILVDDRSEESRVGKECVSKCSSGW